MILEKKTILEGWKKERLRRNSAVLAEGLSSASATGETSGLVQSIPENTEQKKETQQRLRLWREQREAERRAAEVRRINNNNDVL